jgi:hypothetical protein
LLKVAVAMYAADHKGELPKDLKVLGVYCGHDTTVLACPEDKLVSAPGIKDAKAMKAAWDAVPLDKVGYHYTVKAGATPQAVIRCDRHQHEETVPAAKK